MLKLLAAGKTYMSKKAYQWSYDSFTKALDVEPGAPVIMKYLAACRAVPLMHLEKYDEAIVECNKALEVMPMLVYGVPSPSAPSTSRWQVS